ncbi:MAG TPA: signal peptidase I [Pyrinomonadaceae bacterium]|nr:signal peptidase I [Pyrinomonadaceae bacterium]
MFSRKSTRPHAFGGVQSEDDRDIEVFRPEAESRRHFWSETRLLVRDLVFALMIAALFIVFVVQPVKVEGTSMLPRLHGGERIFVNKLIYYGLPEIARGDIVVFWYPDDPDKSYIKRVIGLPGETVEVRDGRVLVDGRELTEPYLDPQLNVSPATLAPVFVKRHYYFVMGDNRDSSYDSRAWGLVPQKYIYGRALFRYWPLSELSVISHETSYPELAPPPGGRRPVPAGESDDDEDESER